MNKNKNSTSATSNTTSNNKIYNGSSDGYVSAGFCRHWPTKVLTCDGVTLYGASGIRVEQSNVPPNVLSLNLSGHSYLKPLPDLTGDEYYVNGLQEHLLGPLPIVDLEWEDREAPAVRYTFWETLHDLLKRDKLDLLVFCMGGHGRTGTALAAYLMANKYAKNKDKYPHPVHRAVTTVRENLCEQCVETKTQLEYLQLLAIDLGWPNSVELENITDSDSYTRKKYVKKDEEPYDEAEEIMEGYTDEVDHAFYYSDDIPQEFKDGSASKK